MKKQIQIKTLWGSVLFEHESKDNSIKKTLEKALSKGAYLRGAYLRGAYLTGADLRKIESYLRIVPEEGTFVAWKK